MESLIWLGIGVLMSSITLGWTRIFRGKGQESTVVSATLALILIVVGEVFAH